MHSSIAARTSRRALRCFTPHHLQLRTLSSTAFFSSAVPAAPHSLRKANVLCDARRLPIATAVRQQRRRKSDEARPAQPLTDRSSSSNTKEPSSQDADAIAARKAQEPAYEMTFTCRKCMNRSTHRITKQAYHFGTTLITCPGCSNRHLISDHLKIFSDHSITIEDILREKGQFIKKGILGGDGDVEFVDDSQLPEELKQK